MAIKIPGQNAPIADAIEGVGKADSARKTEGSGFSESVTGSSTARPSGAPAAADPVQRAITDVAAGIRAGRVQPGEPAITAVIRSIVETQNPTASARETRDRVEELSFVLGTDPTFVQRVERMLNAELEAV